VCSSSIFSVKVFIPQKGEKYIHILYIFFFEERERRKLRTSYSALVIGDDKYKDESTTYALALDQRLPFLSLYAQPIVLASLNLFKKHRATSDSEYDLALCLCKNNIRDYPGHNASMDEIKVGLRAYAADLARLFYHDLISLPGFNTLDTAVIFTMITRCVFPLYSAIIHSRFLINDEWFRQLPNGIQFTYRILERTMNSEMPKRVRCFVKRVQCLKLNDQEAALLLPYMMTLFLLSWFFELIEI
jgi:hypothetical protein